MTLRTSSFCPCPARLFCGGLPSPGRRTLPDLACSRTFFFHTHSELSPPAPAPAPPGLFAAGPQALADAPGRPAGLPGRADGVPAGAQPLPAADGGGGGADGGGWGLGMFVHGCVGCGGRGGVLPCQQELPAADGGGLMAVGGLGWGGWATPSFRAVYTGNKPCMYCHSQLGKQSLRRCTQLAEPRPPGSRRNTVSRP